MDRRDLSGLLLLGAIYAIPSGCNQVWGVDEAYAKDDAGAAETGPDPCQVEPGVAKLCVKFEAQKAHPTYDAAGGATGLEIDGAGRILLFLYDKDPADIDTTYKTLLFHPPEGSGAELKLNEFPVTMTAKLAPGVWWLIARFEDNKTQKRAGDTILLGGDFVTQPTVGAGGRYLYAQVNLAKDAVASTTLTLQPIRRLEVEVSADPTMKTKYKDSAVNGDGPVTFGIYDGTYDTGTYLDYLTTHCVNVGPLATPPSPPKIAFGTTVTGTHNFSADLEDYDTTGTWPRAGTLRTATDATNPTVTISPTSWVASASVKFVQIISPIATGARTDPTKCP